MKRMRRMSSILACILILLMLASCTASPPKSGVEDLSEYDSAAYMTPYWENDYIYNEPAAVIKNADGTVAPIRLLYDVTEIVSVRNHRLNTRYTAGQDYNLTDGKIEILPTGKIFSDIALDYDQYYFDEYVENVNWKLENGGATLKTESDYGRGGMTDYQICVTYRHAKDEERMHIPFEQNQSDKLEKSLEKMRGKQETHVVLVGDSISVGWSASGMTYCNIAPYSPNYIGLVEEYLCGYFENNNIIFDNYAISGETTRMLLREETVTKTKNSSPDLVIIAYGGNDGVAGGLTANEFGDNIQTFITAIRESYPDCEFMVCTSAIVNAEIAGMLVNQPKYSEAVNRLVADNDNVAKVDIYRAINELLLRKRYVDITANNINHPNDFVHRLYAQMIVKTLIEDYQ